jgi:hypothetical protein
MPHGDSWLLKTRVGVMLEQSTEASRDLNQGATGAHPPKHRATAVGAQLGSPSFGRPDARC